MQNLRLPFFCQAASLSRLPSRLPRLGPDGLPGIQWCLLLVGGGPNRRRDRRTPVPAARGGPRGGRGRAAAGLRDAGRCPSQAGTEVVGLDLDNGALLTFLGLPGTLL